MGISLEASADKGKLNNTNAHNTIKGNFFTDINRPPYFVLLFITNKRRLL
jgi:hypothetical protein